MDFLYEKISYLRVWLMAWMLRRIQKKASYLMP